MKEKRLTKYRHMWDSKLKEWVKSPETQERDEEERKSREIERRRTILERKKLD